MHILFTHLYTNLLKHGVITFIWIFLFKRVISKLIRIKHKWQLTGSVAIFCLTNNVLQFTDGCRGKKSLPEIIRTSNLRVYNQVDIKRFFTALLSGQTKFRSRASPVTKWSDGLRGHSSNFTGIGVKFPWSVSVVREWRGTSLMNTLSFNTWVNDWQKTQRTRRPVNILMNYWLNFNSDVNWDNFNKAWLKQIVYFILFTKKLF